MKIVRNISKDIFRGYDIRGIYNVDLTDDVAYTIGLAFGSYIIENGKNKVIVGMDNRASSENLKSALIQGLVETGVNVVDIGLVTTPMYYFSWEYLNICSGLMITASHNPKEYNGFKMAFDESGNAFGEKIQQFREYILKAQFKQGKGSIEKVNILYNYIERILSNIDLGARNLRVVVDPGNGTAAAFVKEIFNKFNSLDVKYICDISDPAFPNHHPDPSVEENTKMLKEAVLDFHADVGLALDGDADRIGVIDEKGEYIPIDHYLIIMARDLLKKNKDYKILFDVKCTKALEDDIKALGGTYERYKVGNSYIKYRMKEGDFALGGEFSGHVFFRDKWSGFDDGIYAGLRLIELMTHTNKPLSQMQNGINKYFSSPEVKVHSTEEEKYILVSKVKEYAIKKGYNFSTIDGVRVEEPDWWALVRASQTGPDVTMRFEAKTMEKLKDIQKEFEEVVLEKGENK